MLHRPRSPTSIEELPAQWTATASPPGGSSPALPRSALPLETSTLTAASAQSSSADSGIVRHSPQNGIISRNASRSTADRKGKGRQIIAQDDDEMIDDGQARRSFLSSEACCSDSEIDNDINISAGQTSMKHTVAYAAPFMLPSGSASSIPPMLQLGPTLDVPYRPHHPQNEASAFGFGVKGNPGGDCKRVCLRHQRMVDGGARVELQKVC